MEFENVVSEFVLNQNSLRSTAVASLHCTTDTQMHENKLYPCHVQPVQTLQQWT